MNCSREKEDFFEFLGDLNLAMINIKQNVKSRSLQILSHETYKVLDEALLSKVKLV